MGERSYDPSLGRFLTEDPVLGHLGIGASVNRYPYAWDNPLNRYDLNGRDVCVLGACTGDVAEDVVGAGEEIAGGVEMAEEGVDAIRAGAEEAANWTAPGRTWIADRARDFWKRYRGPLEDVYAFAGANWQTCRNGAAAGAASGFVIGSVIPAVRNVAGTAAGTGLGCVGLVGASAGITAVVEQEG
jgi:hypothetical protein